MKRVLLVGLVIGGVALFLFLRDPPALLEQARQLHEVEPYEMPGLTLGSWTRDGVVLEARYEGRRSPAGFTMTLWPTDDDAREQFVETVESLASPEHLDTLNAAERLDYCVEESGSTTCIGIEDNRTFESHTTGRDEEAELDASYLMRIARKHWYRVF